MNCNILDKLSGGSFGVVFLVHEHRAYVMAVRCLQAEILSRMFLARGLDYLELRGYSLVSLRQSLKVGSKNDFDNNSVYV